MNTRRQNDADTPYNRKPKTTSMIEVVHVASFEQWKRLFTLPAFVHLDLLLHAVVRARKCRLVHFDGRTFAALRTVSSNKV